MLEKRAVIYEQPSNEAMRICLRLEHLLDQFSYYVARKTPQDSDIAVFSVMKILDLLGRPDLKSKLAQLMSQCLVVLARLKDSPEVDLAKLGKTSALVQTLLDRLHQIPGKIAEHLSADPFFNQIRLPLNTSGTVHFTPSYRCWLFHNEERRATDLENWEQELRLLSKATSTILKIARETAPIKKVKALQGLYQQVLNPNVQCHLIRITLDSRLSVYPEISVGKYRCVVRFLISDTSHHRPQKYDEDVECDLQCCYF